MKLAPLALALGGCALYFGPPPDPDAAPLFGAEGELTLHSTVTSELCTAPTPRDPLVLTVTSDTVTAAPPAVVAGSNIHRDRDYAVVNLEVLDTWGAQPIDLGYNLTVTPDGRVHDYAGGSFADGHCDLTVTIEGTYNPR